MASSSSDSGNSMPCLGKHGFIFLMSKKEKNQKGTPKRRLCYQEEIPQTIIAQAGYDAIAYKLTRNCKNLSGTVDSYSDDLLPATQHRLVVVDQDHHLFIKAIGDCNCRFKIYFEGKELCPAPGTFKACNNKPILVDLFETADSKAVIKLKITDIGLGDEVSDDSAIEQKKKLMALGQGTIRVAICKNLGKEETSDDDDDEEDSDDDDEEEKKKVELDYDDSDDDDDKPKRKRCIIPQERKKMFMSKAASTEKEVFKTMNIGLTMEEGPIRDYDDDDENDDNNEDEDKYEAKSFEEIFFYYRTHMGYLHEKKILYEEPDLKKLDKRTAWVKEQEEAEQKQKQLMEQRRKARQQRELNNDRRRPRAAVQEPAAPNVAPCKPEVEELAPQASAKKPKQEKNV